MCKTRNAVPSLVKKHDEVCRSPDEMRMKLSVQFQGEEGIDAGGVSREWYQVIQTSLAAFVLGFIVPAEPAACAL